MLPIRCDKWQTEVDIMRAPVNSCAHIVMSTSKESTRPGKINRKARAHTHSCMDISRPCGNVSEPPQGALGIDENKWREGERSEEQSMMKIRGTEGLEARMGNTKRKRTKGGIINPKTLGM